MNSRRILLILCTTLSPAFAQAQCVGNGMSWSANHQSARITIATNAQFLTNGVGLGIGQWNATACNSQGDSFPYFLDQGAGSVNINIIYKLGLGPTSSSGSRTTICSRYLGSGSGGDIEVYDQWRDANDVIRSCQNSRTQLVSDRIAHELGHFLGLSNSSCQGSVIMGPAVWSTSNGFSIDRSVQPQECTFADTKNETPTEDTGCEPGNQDCGSQEIGSPIVIDLDRNNFHFAGLGDPVVFDIDADGTLESTGWTSVDSFDAFLVLDRDGDGNIRDASELFGDSTPLLAGGIAEHGFQALAEFDDFQYGGNGDGFIEPNDLGFSLLRLWIDYDHDGISDQDELLSLNAAGIVKINLDYRLSPRRDQHGNLLRYLGEAWIQHGEKLRRCTVTDVFFVFWDE